MKKFFKLGMLLVLVLGIAGVSYASVDKTYEAAVINYSGDVKVDTKGDGIWITPWVGMKLKEEALLKTGPGANAQIVFDADERNVLSIDENTQIKIQKAMVDMPEGNVVANFANLKPGSSFIVKTPDAACGIRGSIMQVIRRLGKTLAKAFKSNVYVQGLDARGNPTGKANVLKEGTKSGIGSGGRIEGAEQLTGDDQSGLDQVEGDTGAGADEAEAEAEAEPEVDPKDLDDVKEEESKSDTSPSS